MKRKQCWAIKIKTGKFVNQPIIQNYWEADRTLLFRSKKFAEQWLENNPFWSQKCSVVKTIVIVKEVGE